MVVNIDISYASKLLAACVKIVKAQCSATIGISEGHGLAMDCNICKLRKL